MNEINHTSLLSIIIPVKNEQDSLLPMLNQLLPILRQLPMSYEIIVVNDGSTDDTLKFLVEQKIVIPELKILDLSRNFGKEAALYAGMAYSSGDCAIAIDADLQDPPELILDMVDYWLQGYEVVTAVHDLRASDSYMKRTTSGLFYNIINRLSDTKLTPHAGDYRLLDRVAINAFLQLNEKIRFNKGLLTWIGFKEKTISHLRSERVMGETKWNYFKLFNFAIDGITSFSTTPLDIWLYLGVAISTSSFLYAIFILVRTLIFGINVPGYASLLIFMLFFSGLQIIGIGILGKYIGRIFTEVKNRPIFITRKFYE